MTYRDPNPLLRGISRSDGVCKEVFDFFCHELELVIEIDGNSHDRENAYEKDRELSGKSKM
jgi:very-short-patch-repair endonuclease